MNPPEDVGQLLSKTSLGQMATQPASRHERPSSVPLGSCDGLTGIGAGFQRNCCIQPLVDTH